jgi:NAD(P)-dependent dehydrogenase (short-subunit alcohol dehydrogenase family)
MTQTQTHAGALPADFTLTGKRAVVTGASRGLGYDIAIALADYGADVVGFARTASELAALETEITARGRRFVAVTGGVDDHAALETLVRRADAEFGGIDILVNNAGISFIEPAIDVTHEHWDAQFAVNLSGAFFCAQAAARGMIARGYGRIINISSISGVVGMLDHAAYVATKGGLNALTASLAMEWGPHGITVNAIAPTVVLTAMGERVWGLPEKGDPMKAKIPIGRFGKPREIAAAVVYLASDAAGLVNGHVLVLDGGYTAA